MDLIKDALTFGLEVLPYDVDPASDNDEVFAVPCLHAYSNATLAAALNEGINIWEDDFLFFAGDGAPLKANFSKMPYVDSEKLVYFRGVYTLEPGTGPTLQEHISDVVPNIHAPGARIIMRLPESGATARVCGWASPQEMKDTLEVALRALLPNMISIVQFERNDRW